ncbi:MAG: RHS repeat domain-containing protein, partial [Gemmataceae bacterium]
GPAGDKYVGFDTFGRVVDQNWVKAGTSVDRNSYTYDRDGNRTAKTNPLNTSLSEVYSYDGLNQLASFDRNSGARTQNWGYDALGNWNSVTTNGVAQTRGHNQQNEITSVSGATTPTYDANGNMTKDETGLQYVYDAWNQLKAVKDTGGTVVKSYQYDGLNRRVAETVNGVATDLYYSASWQVLEERVDGMAKASTVWSPVYVDAMIARDRDADNNGTLEERLYPTHDANFNVTALFNTAGVVVEKYAYDPFGAVTIYDASNAIITASAYGWQHFHQGGRRDSTTGLYHFRHREYSPTLGRWVTMDPIGYQAGDVNLYGYVGSNPIIYVDPLGSDRWYYDPNDTNRNSNVISNPIIDTYEPRQYYCENLSYLPSLSGIYIREYERGCIGLCNLRLGLPIFDFPEKKAIACYTSFDLAYKRMQYEGLKFNRESGRRPRIFAKIVESLPGAVSEYGFNALEEIDLNNGNGGRMPFGTGMFDYCTLHMPYNDAKSWYWESMNWSLSSAGESWCAIRKKFPCVARRECLGNVYGPFFRYPIYCVVLADSYEPNIPRSYLDKGLIK